MIPQETILKIIRSATKAPSGHNLQPWLFATDDNSICIMPDYNRVLPIADPFNRELFISLGCAAQNLMIAAQFHGYHPTLQIFKHGKPCMIKILLHYDAAMGQPELYPYINIRQTTRKAYSSKLIPPHDLDALKATANYQGVKVRIFNKQVEMDWFNPYITLANAIQMNDPEFKTELIKWMRFSENEAMQQGDGLYSAAIGMPSVGRWLGSVLLKNLISVGSEEKRLLKLMDKTAALALFTSDTDDLESWIRTGMAFQNFSLHATKLNISHSFVNQPCQVPKVRSTMANQPALQNEFPQLLVRLGYAGKMTRSFRRRVSEVMVG